MITRWLDAPPEDREQVTLEPYERAFAGEIMAGAYTNEYNIRPSMPNDFIYRSRPNVDALDKFFTWYTNQTGHNTLTTRAEQRFTRESMGALDAFAWDTSDGRNNFDIKYRFTEGVRDNEFQGVFTQFAANPGTLDRIMKMWSEGRESRSTYGKGEYGAEGLSFRLLYEILCNSYNQGEYFVDTYLTERFPQSAVYREFLSVKNGIVQEMAKDLYKNQMQYQNSPNARLRSETTGRFISASGATPQDVEQNYRRVFGGWGDFSVWQNQYYRQRLDSVAAQIREDIISDLSTGAIPLNHSNTSATKQKRIEAGLPPDPEFFASGQLINNLEIYIDLDMMMEAA